MKTKDLGWKENYGIQNNGTEDSQENIICREGARTENLAELYDRAL